MKKTLLIIALCSFMATPLLAMEELKVHFNSDTVMKIAQRKNSSYRQRKRAGKQRARKDRKRSIRKMRDWSKKKYGGIRKG